MTQTSRKHPSELSESPKIFNCVGLEQKLKIRLFGPFNTTIEAQKALEDLEAWNMKIKTVVVLNMVVEKYYTIGQAELRGEFGALGRHESIIIITGDK